jgi:hypothetical protein
MQEPRGILRVTRILTAGRPACEARITLPAPGTRALRTREYEAEQRKLRPDQCAKPAAFAVDRKMLCERCAGAAALRILMER